MLLAKIGMKIIYYSASQGISCKELIFCQSTTDQYFSKNQEKKKKNKPRDHTLGHHSNSKLLGKFLHASPPSCADLMQTTKLGLPRPKAHAVGDPGSQDL